MGRRDWMWAAGAAVVMLAVPAGAFPWMVKNGVASCAACHVDPSGAGQLTVYGRGESERLVRWTPWARDPGQAVVSPLPRFLWAVELPEALNLSASVRTGVLFPSTGEERVVFLQKQADVSATVNLGDEVVFHGSAGFGGGQVVAPAIAFPACDPASGQQCGASLLTPVFWVGVKAAQGEVMLRGGRMPVPFGLRNIEHTSWVRQLTRTDTLASQQLGAAAAYTGPRLRAEVMGLAGSFTPSTREGGYAAFLEYAMAPTFTLGASSLVAHPLGPAAGSATRHAHGLFSRWAPVPALALLAEVDLLAWAGGGQDRLGYAAFLQADWEVVTGLHLMATAESAHRGPSQVGPSLGGWVSMAWYFFSHCELRIDGIVRRLDALGPPSVAAVAQVHFYL